jgi:hypothetical protein
MMHHAGNQVINEDLHGVPAHAHVQKGTKQEQEQGM